MTNLSPLRWDLGWVRVSNSIIGRGTFLMRWRHSRIHWINNSMKTLSRRSSFSQSLVMLRCSNSYSLELFVDIHYQSPVFYFLFWKVLQSRRSVSECSPRFRRYVYMCTHMATGFVQEDSHRMILLGGGVVMGIIGILIPCLQANGVIGFNTSCGQVWNNTSNSICMRLLDSSSIEMYVYMCRCVYAYVYFSWFHFKLFSRQKCVCSRTFGLRLNVVIKWTNLRSKTVKKCAESLYDPV